jgi:hypothetical protein
LVKLYRKTIPKEMNRVLWRFASGVNQAQKQ